MTFTLLPTWITVGVIVSRSMAPSERRMRGVSHEPLERGLGRRRVTGGEVSDLAQVQCREELADDAGRLAGGGRLDQAGDRLRQPDGRILGVGHAAVAGRPGGAQAGPDDALLGDLDGVHPPVADRHRVAADLVQGRGRRPGGGREQVGPGVDPVLRAVRAAGLLVGNGGEDHVPPERNDRTDAARP